ncbi:MAG TPA: hypothetical protein PL141_14525 [Thermoflexales bacterium]|nr:hypothetical protein [Thermoflexales bacterium]
MSESANTIEIVECKTKAERKQFITFQWEIYKGNPYWVPPLMSEREAFWDKEKNPFFEHSETAMFLAKRGGKAVGTIAATRNEQHLKFHPDGAGFFGGFEVIREYAVAEKLFDAAKAWVKSRGLSVMRGPATLDMNGECGLLVDGFEMEPLVLMPYNPPYYQEFIERYGFKKAQDLWAWWNPIEVAVKAVEGRFMRLAEAAQKRGKFTIRTANLKNIDHEIQVLKKVYAGDDSAWKDNWGNIPMTDHEIDHTVKGLKQFADSDLIFIAEKDGEPIAVSISLPNVNHPLRLAYPSPNTLEPLTLAKFLWHRRTSVSAVRFIILGVLPEHRMSGVDTCLIMETLKAVVNKKYTGAELSWILESNDAMNRVAKLGGGSVYKTYRMYDVEL